MNAMDIDKFTFTAERVIYLNSLWYSSCSSNLGFTKENRKEKKRNESYNISYVLLGVFEATIAVQN